MNKMQVNDKINTMNYRSSEINIINEIIVGIIAFWFVLHNIYKALMESQKVLCKILLWNR